VLGLVLDMQCSGATGLDAIGCPPIGVGTVAGAAILGGLGALIGLGIPRDVWSTVKPMPFDVVPTVVEGRPGIALHVEW
jgi:hypothetical protein